MVHSGQDENTAEFGHYILMKIFLNWTISVQKIIKGREKMKEKKKKAALKLGCPDCGGSCRAVEIELYGRCKNCETRSESVPYTIINMVSRMISWHWRLI